MRNMSDSETVDQLSAFACEVYSNSTVSEACLALQDRYDIDVPLLLFCCWAGRHYGVLPEVQLKQALSFVRAWSSHATKPLRAIRRDMKTRYSPQWPVLDTEWSDLRERVKQAELASEKMMLSGLSHLLDQSPSTSNEHNGLSDAVANIACYFQFIGCQLKGPDVNSDGDIQAYLIDILSAAFSVPKGDVSPLLFPS